MTETALDRATELAPLIERVHGPNHPELTRVRELTEQIAAAGPGGAVGSLFAELRSVTNDFVLPEDACEAYTGTYEALRAAEAALAPRA
ncbi:MAG TPA: iron-sulfur cluster repair di-iron protein, ric [Actinomycetales bacterium]|nr:iron-sulfur cluster repair di-iron protein, ric [Actinomycetales bacterium]